MDLSKYLKNLLYMVCFFLCYQQLLGRPKQSTRKENTLLPGTKSLTSTTKITQLNSPVSTDYRKTLSTILPPSTSVMRSKKHETVSMNPQQKTSSDLKRSETLKKQSKVKGITKGKGITKKGKVKTNRNTKKSKMKKKGIERLKEFPLQHLINIGITSNEANQFIKNDQLRGKPLEQQYEKVRETDMNNIEVQLLKQRQLLQKIVKMKKKKKN